MLVELTFPSQGELESCFKYIYRRSWGLVYNGSRKGGRVYLVICCLSREICDMYTSKQVYIHVLVFIWVSSCECETSGSQQSASLTLRCYTSIFADKSIFCIYAWFKLSFPCEINHYFIGEWFLCHDKAHLQNIPCRVQTARTQFQVQAFSRMPYERVQPQ